MNIIIRVDSSKEIGTGHVMRCITLASQLREKGCSVSFICRKLEGNVNELILKNEFALYEISSESIESISTWYKEHWRNDAESTLAIIEKECILIDLLIVDHYSLDYQWEGYMKAFVNKLMVVDDLANRKHDCHLLLDQNYKIDFEKKYDSLVPDDCRLLLGPNYLLLRDEFMDYANNIVYRSGEIRRILVFFGGTDPTQETLKTLKALLKFKMEWCIDVIVGNSNNQKDQIKALCDNFDHYHYYSQVNNISYFMNEADLAIGAGGTTTWERCFMGLPSITVIVADNQKEVTRAVSEFGATINLGEAVTEDMIYKKVQMILRYPKIVKDLSRQALKLVNPKTIKKNLVVEEIFQQMKH